MDVDCGLEPLSNESEYPNDDIPPLRPEECPTPCLSGVGGPQPPCPFLVQFPELRVFPGAVLLPLPGALLRIGAGRASAGEQIAARGSPIPYANYNHVIGEGFRTVAIAHSPAEIRLTLADDALSEIEAAIACARLAGGETGRVPDMPTDAAPLSYNYCEMNGRRWLFLQSGCVGLTLESPLAPPECGLTGGRCGLGLGDRLRALASIFPGVSVGEAPGRGSAVVRVDYRAEEVFEIDAGSPVGRRAAPREIRHQVALSIGWETADRLLCACGL